MLFTVCIAYRTASDIQVTGAIKLARVIVSFSRKIYTSSNMILLVITTLCLTQIQGLEESYSYEDSSNIGNFGKMQMQYPWLAMILDENIPICSGSIISDKVILTSAQCTWKPMASLNVWVGSSPVGREGGSRHGIKGIKRYEEYHVFGFNVSNSIALMKVSPHFDFNERVNKVLLPNNMDFIATYRGAIVNTWMIKASEEMKDRYDYFMEVGSLLVSPHRQCSHILGLSKSPGLFCATLQNRELSFVDFGGPVVTNGIQIGIVPFKFYGTISQAPELYIDVGFYRDWIDKKLLVM